MYHKSFYIGIVLTMIMNNYIVWKILRISLHLQIDSVSCLRIVVTATLRLIKRIRSTYTTTGVVAVENQVQNFCFFATKIFMQSCDNFRKINILQFVLISF